MIEFARAAREWMEADPQNVIAVHCKGGKGRTGTVICTWLIESGDFGKAQVSPTYTLKTGGKCTKISVRRNKEFENIEGKKKIYIYKTVLP